jgi:uncharacterized protein YecE (DUF72 family)
MGDFQIRFPKHVLVGTSSWSSPDWRGSFYPESIAPGDMISTYASRLPTVEIDSTWYQIPSRPMVEAWNARTPAGFVFSAKVPRVITHEKYLEGCEEDLKQFVSVMAGLGDKLGPMVLQFPYVAKGKDPEEYATGAQFLERLKKFVRHLPDGFRWGIEIRNSRWVKPELLDLLRSRQISLVFIDYYTMDPLPRLVSREEVFTSGFVYVRFLGNHKEMDAAVAQARADGRRSSDWGSLLVDRTAQMKSWIPAMREISAGQIPMYVYFNNHFAGYAPGSIELFSRLWNDSDSRI